MSKTLLTRWGLSIILVAVIVIAFQGIQHHPKFQVAEASTDNTYASHNTTLQSDSAPLTMPSELLNAPELNHTPYEAFPSSTSQYDEQSISLSEPSSYTSYTSSTPAYTASRHSDDDYKKYEDNYYNGKYDDDKYDEDKYHADKYKDKKYVDKTYDVQSYEKQSAVKKYDDKHDEKKKDHDKDDHDD